MQTITPKELEVLRRRRGTVDLIDVRTPLEFHEVHAEAARSVPLDRLDPGAVMKSRDGAEGDPLYVICRSGSRSSRACDAFRAAGFANVVNVEGGTLAWERAGLPVVRGEKDVSLERQSRIAAGSLMVLGMALGAIVHPAFFGLAVLGGAGMVLARVADACGMGMILARMPWNRGKPEAPTRSR